MQERLLEAVVLFEGLACEDLLPVQWRKCESDWLNQQRLGVAERNVSLLKTCISLEEQVVADQPDQRSTHQADLVRLDIKVSLLLDLVARLYAASHPLPEKRAIRFNSLGATLTDVSFKDEVGSVGLLEVHLRPCLLDPLQLPGRVVSVEESGSAKISFERMEEPVADLLEKLAFIRHRRQVAEFKRTSAGP